MIYPNENKNPANYFDNFMKNSFKKRDLGKLTHTDIP